MPCRPKKLKVQLITVSFIEHPPSFTWCKSVTNDDASDAANADADFDENISDKTSTASLSLAPSKPIIELSCHSKHKEIVDSLTIRCNPFLQLTGEGSLKQEERERYSLGTHTPGCDPIEILA